MRDRTVGLIYGRNGKTLMVILVIPMIGREDAYYVVAIAGRRVLAIAPRALVPKRRRAAEVVRGFSMPFLFQQVGKSDTRGFSLGHILFSLSPISNCTSGVSFIS